MIHKKVGKGWGRGWNLAGRGGGCLGWGKITFEPLHDKNLQLGLTSLSAEMTS